MTWLENPIGVLSNLENDIGLWWCLGCPWRRRPARGLVGPGDAPRCPARRGRARGASGWRLEHRRTAGERGAGRLMSVMLDPTSAALFRSSLPVRHHATSTPFFLRQKCANMPTSTQQVVRHCFAFPDNSRTEQVSDVSCLSRGLRRAPASDEAPR